MKLSLVITIILLVGISQAAPEGLFKTGREFGFERERFKISKADLNKPISPYNVHFYIQTSGDKVERNLDLIVTIDRPSTKHTNKKEEIPGQVIPYMAFWQIRDGSGTVYRQWEPRFVDRTRSGPGDTLYTTYFSLSEEELKQSHLLVYFEVLGLGEDSKRADATFDIDMTDFDWSPTSLGRGINIPIKQ